MPELMDRLETALHGRYRLEREIGRGGMATVYLAEDLRHGRKVAIKVMRPELTGLGYEPERFHREIRIAARLNHPGILPIFDSGEVESEPVAEVAMVAGLDDSASRPARPPRPARLLYFIMPYMGCESLRDRIAGSDRLSMDDALHVTRGVAAALDYAHRQGIVHRDIKPENILLYEGQPVVADFGIARALSAAGGPSIAMHLSQPGLALGTPAYMSPEQATADELDGRSDVYSLACVLYEMLAGTPPFTGASPREVMLRHVTEPVPSLRTERVAVPSAVTRALTRALAKSPTDRFATAGQFAEALATLATPATPATTSIAVLPLSNTSGDPGTEYFADGMTDELINALAKVQGLRVASRSSVFALKGTRHDTRAIGALLEVSTVLEGSVRTAGDRLRITAQLSSVADGSLLWSERFDRKMEDVFAIQEEIAGTIVSTLRANFLGDLGDPTSRRYTDNLKAYNLYLKGRYAWNQRTQEAIAEGIRWFEQAIAEDPDYALAYTGLSDSYALLIDYRGAPVAEGMRRAEAEARHALALDESLAEAHTSLGWVTFIYKWEWAEADREFRRAIQLNPRYATARQWYAWLLLAMGRIDEGMAHGRAAAELDPGSVSIRRSLGWLHLYARQPDIAMEHLRRALAMNPSLEESHLILGHALAQKGMHAAAETEFREAMSLTSENTRGVSALGALLAQQGRRDEARALLEGLYERARARYVSPVDFVTLHIALGDTDAAFEWLERTYEQRRGWLAYLKVEPVVDPLRGDPRFTGLLRRMNLG